MSKTALKFSVSIVALLVASNVQAKSSLDGKTFENRCQKYSNLFKVSDELMQYSHYKENVPRTMKIALDRCLKYKEFVENHPEDDNICIERHREHDSPVYGNAVRYYVENCLPEISSKRAYEEAHPVWQTPQMRQHTPEVKCNLQSNNSGMHTNYDMVIVDGFDASEIVSDLSNIYMLSNAFAKKQCKRKSPDNLPTHACLNYNPAYDSCLVWAKVEGGTVTSEVNLEKERLMGLANFISENKVDAAVNMSELEVNPFAYKGQTVLMMGHWNRMLTESEALMRSDYQGTVLLTNVSVKDFKDSAEICLIVGKVIGRKSVSGLSPFGELQLAHIEFKEQVCRNPAIEYGLRVDDDWNWAGKLLR